MVLFPPFKPEPSELFFVLTFIHGAEPPDKLQSSQRINLDGNAVVNTKLTIVQLHPLKSSCEHAA